MTGGEEMTLKQRAFYKTAVGFALGILVDVVIHVIFMAGRQDADFGASRILTDLLGNHDLAIVTDILLGGVLGAVCNGSSVVYEIEHWSVLRSTLTHLLLCIVVYFTVGSVLEWFEPGVTAFNIMQAVLWVLAYIMIWMIQFLVYRKEIREINQRVEQMKERGR